LSLLNQFHRHCLSLAEQPLLLGPENFAAAAKQLVALSFRKD
jgi:hypothetical protein